MHITIKRLVINYIVIGLLCTRGRKKKAKLSESGETDSEQQVTSQEQLNSPPHEAKPEVKTVVPKAAARSPKKLPPPPKVTKVTPQPAPLPQGNDNIDMIHQDFDRHQADLAEKMEEGDEEEEEELVLVPAHRATTKIPTKGRGRPSVAAKPPPPSMTGMDDANDEVKFY
uniref:Uncharacterized protein n=1 Tax=Panagrolaimus superbus TaxID=310955 RepID=A0A914YNH4_9BILA